MRGADEPAAIALNNRLDEQPIPIGDGQPSEKKPPHPSPLPRRRGRGDRSPTSRAVNVERSLFDDDELAAAGDAEPDRDDAPPWYDDNGLALPVGSSDENLVEPWRRILIAQCWAILIAMAILMQQ